MMKYIPMKLMIIMIYEVNRACKKVELANEEDLFLSVVVLCEMPGVHISVGFVMFST